MVLGGGGRVGRQLDDALLLAARLEHANPRLGSVTHQDGRYAPGAAVLRMRALRGGVEQIVDQLIDLKCGSMNI